MCSAVACSTVVCVTDVCVTALCSTDVCSTAVCSIDVCFTAVCSTVVIEYRDLPIYIAATERDTLLMIQHGHYTDLDPNGFRTGDDWPH